MRSLSLTIPVLGLCCLAGCGSDSGLLDLTLTSDSTSPPGPGTTVDLLGPGGLHRSWAGQFPPETGGALRLQYPGLPVGRAALTVQTLDGRGCVVGESAAFDVDIEAGKKVTATTVVHRSSKACGDAGVIGGGTDGGAQSSDADRNDVAGGDATSSGLDSAGADGEAVGDVDVSAETAGSADRPSPEADTPDGSVPFDGAPSAPDAPWAPGPIIISFSASPATISVGSSTTLTAVFSNAVGSSVDHGIGSLTSGNGVGTGPLTTTTTYKLTITDASGNSTTQSVTVTVVPLPSIASFTASSATVAVGTLTQLRAVFADGTGSVDHNLGTIANGGTLPTGTLFASATYTLTVTNAAGDSATKPLSISVSGTVGPGQFAATGSMHFPRENHTATLLANGTVLIAGGSPDGDTRAEIYDPESATFALVGRMTTSRTGLSATPLPNGKVLLVGGSGDHSAEIYDPMTETFHSTGDALQAREYHVAVLLANGKVLVAGGIGDSLDPTEAKSILSAAEIYDPETGIFTATGSMTQPRRLPNENVLGDGKVLVAGGISSSSASLVALASAELYDPSTSQFSETGSMIHGRKADVAVALLDGRVLVAGGVVDEDLDYVLRRTSEVYTATNGTFALSGSMGTDRESPTATVLPNGEVLVAGGWSDTVPGPIASAELYHPETGTFTAANPMTTARYFPTATLLPNGKVLIAGGGIMGLTDAQQHVQSTAELYW